MLKFTFASIFLTLASVFALIAAVPTSGRFSIFSARTGGFIFSDRNAQVGGRVITIPFDEATYVNTALTITLTSSPKDTINTFSVQGIAGFYIAVENSYLVWSKELYNWDLRAEERDLTVVFAFTVPNQNLYWFVDSSSPDVSVQPISGSGESYFILVPNFFHAMS